MRRFVYREASVEDAEAIMALYRIIGQETDNFTFGTEGLFSDVQKQQEDILNSSNDDKAFFLLVLLKDELIGYGRLLSMPRRLSHRAELAIAVKKSYWNNGIGKQIMERLIHNARISGIELIDLRVRSDNQRAIHLYHKFGFKTVGTIPAYLKIGDVYHDTDLMCLDLRQRIEE